MQENDQRKAYEAKMEAKKRQKEAELQKKSEGIITISLR